MGTSYAVLRRTLASRMNLWGGDISTGGAATASATSTSNTLIDVNRTEPDDEWNSAWIVLNPGSSDQVGSPTIWRRVADTGGWVQSTGTATILGTWPSPYASGVTSSTPYEMYKVYRPEHWIQAVNYALKQSYPNRHRSVPIEIPQDRYTRVLDYGFLAKETNSLSNPTSALTVTEIADGAGAFQPGTYTVTYTYYNDFGESLQASSATVTIVGTNSRIQVSALSSVPAAVWGANFYCSIQPNDTTLDMLSIGQAEVVNFPTTITTPGLALYSPGQNLNGTIYGLKFATPNPWFGVSPPQYNTTTVDFFRLHSVLQRINPGAYPEVWNDLGSDLYRPLGGNKLMLMYSPVNQYTLKLVLTTQVPTLAGETDVTQEPSEMIYWGAEWYLWELLIKISQIVNAAWKDLAQAARVEFENLKAEYKMDKPRDIVYRPLIRTMY